MPTARAHLPAISALRFLAAGWVLLFHSLWFFAPVLPEPLAGMVANGYLGVNLFFLLSGFVLAHAYLSETGGLTTTLREFWVARAARVLPVYALGWVAYLGFSLWDAFRGAPVPGGQWLAGAASALLLQAWWPELALAWNSPGWSLSVEAFLYLCFPAVLPVIARSRRPWAFALGGWAATLVVPALYVVLAPDGAGAGHRLGTASWLSAVKFFPPLHLGSFVAGTAAGVLFLRGKLTWLRGPAWGIGLVVAFVAATAVDPGPLFPLVHNGLLAPLFLLGIGWCASVRRVPKVADRLGEASYSLYILQYPLHELFRRILEATDADLIGRKATAAYALFATVASLAAFRLVEEPARKAIRARWREARGGGPAGEGGGEGRPGLLARAFWLHPTLAAVAPVLFAFLNANDLLDPLESWPLLAACAATGLGLSLVGWAVLRDRRWGGLGATLLVLALHFTGGLSGLWLPAAWLAVAGALAAAFRFRRVRVEWPTVLANVFVVVWTGLGVLGVLQGSRAALAAPVVRPVSLPAVAPPPSPDERPDVYLLILDGFGRADVLEESQGFRPRLPALLEERGFFVGADVYASHSQTALALSSYLGLDYVDALVDEVGTRSRRPLRALIEDGAALRLLRSAGYRIVSIPGEYSMTRLPGADETRPAGCVVDEFDYHFVAFSALPKLFGWVGLPPHLLTHSVRRACLGNQLERFAAPLAGDGPSFVFAHLVAPHPPFVFRPDGAARTTAAGTMADGPGFHLTNQTAELYSPGYHAMTEWLAREVPVAVDRIRREARREPIILVLGDHGAGHGLDWTHPTREMLRERMGILSAVLVPERIRKELGPSTGPVNLLRRVVGDVTGAALPPLPERVLFSSWHVPYEFREVGQTVRAPAVADAP